MNLQQAASNTKLLWKKNVEQQAKPVPLMWLPKRSEDGKGVQHIMFVLDEVEDGRVAGEKGHRWLGWAQGFLCAQGDLSLDDCKYANVLS